jgi:hypothetical protein
LKTFTPPKGVPIVPDIYILIPHWCTVKHLANGYIGTNHPVTGERMRSRFLPTDAWQYGYVRGNSSDPLMISEAMLAAQQVQALINLIPRDQIAEIIGPCSHDI